MEKFYFVPPHLVEKTEAFVARVRREKAEQQKPVQVDSTDAPLQPDNGQHPSVLRRIFAKSGQSRS